MKSIADIQSSWVRRSVLVMAAPIVFPISIFYGAFAGAYEWTVDAFEAMRSAWRGKSK